LKSKNKLFFASGNVGKVKEIRRLLPDYEILDLSELDIEIEETGTTFRENALIKAKEVYDKFHMLTLSDDSGIACDALEGAPGVYSKRFAGTGIDEDNNTLLVEKLQGKDRTCRFVSCLCLYDGENVHYFEGEVVGSIIDTPRGNNGFGYDPIFFLKEENKTFAELTLEEKNKYSHRARALRKLLDSGLL
jgi:XTP/dITP diphosphohydrolase